MGAARMTEESRARAVESLLPLWEKDRMRGESVAEREKAFRACTLTLTLSRQGRGDRTSATVRR